MEKITPVLSIIVPVYNVEQYLPRCIDSILGQTFQDFELILVDDGSPDRCGLICDEYAKKDSRIIVIHQENKGVCYARNIGIDYSRGKYLTFIDSDDKITRDTLELNIRILENDNQIDFIQIPIKTINKSTRYWDGKYCKKLDRSETLFYWYDNTNISYSIWSKIFRKSIFYKLRFPKTFLFAEDLFLIPDILEKINTVYLSKYGCYEHFCHAESITSFCPPQKTTKKNENIFDSFYKFIKYVSRNDKYIKIQIFLFKNTFTYFLNDILCDKKGIRQKIRTCKPKLHQVSTNISFKNNLWIILINLLGIFNFAIFYKIAIRIHEIKNRSFITTIKEFSYYLFYRIPLIIKGKLKKNIIYVHWGRGLNNFGDCLQPDILKFYGLTPVYVSSINKSDIILAGSILQWTPNNYSGYIIGTGGDNTKYSFPNATILAVRGRLTLSNIEGTTTKIKLGDPGLLMSLVYPQKEEIRYKLGIVPHFVDKDKNVIKKWKNRFGSEVLFIDVLESPKEVIKNIKQCSAIISSSLHGLIIADAFHIPNIRFVDRNTMPTPFYDYKFHDYYSSLDCESSFLEVNGEETLAELINSTTLKPKDKIETIQQSLNQIMIDCTNKFKLK